MKSCVLLSLLLALACTHVSGAPVEATGVEAGSCEDPQAKAAARLALMKINQDRKEGYVFSLHRLSNVHMFKHGETGVVFYLTLDVVETNCSVLSKTVDCESRPVYDTPVYGQCKAAIYTNRPHRVVRLYKYDCVVRPVPARKVNGLCPDCPMYTSADDDQVKKTMSVSLEKFNKESGMSKHFALLKFNRALVSMGILTAYHVEYTIQETTCSKSTEEVTAEKCPLMSCEFSHKGFCKGSFYIPPNPTAEPEVTVDCKIFEPEAAERQKKLHLLGGETDHNHTHTVDDANAHDHVNDHTKSHAEHDKAPANSDHDHSHDHAAGSGHRHAHDHSHDHGHGHDHAHAHHAKAHDHSGDSPNHHHDYKHGDGVRTHAHDHELALDHDHKHPHLHMHEHHHHHHEHEHEKEAHDHVQGMVRLLPAMDPNQPMTIPCFPDTPAAPEVGVVLPLKLDPQIPAMLEPTIEPFPTALSPQCVAPVEGESVVDKMFIADPTFKAAA